MAYQRWQNTADSERLLTPRLYRVIFILLCLSVLFIGLHWMMLCFLLPLIVIHEIALFGARKPSLSTTTICQHSPWQVLRASDGYLYIGNRALPLSSITEVTLNCHPNYVALQLPYNRTDNFFPEVRFSPVYLPAVKAFIRLRMPDSTMRVTESTEAIVSSGTKHPVS
ncbi:hypothetical protein [Salinimonas chungwhensis]|uniref:hypothetical protein n=1 Tax=Salinimonas chungwhensis TaxID=265425 RepID=UPI000362635E|nr:hypothetical protein [Salinimonas chungwhensis]